MTPILNYFSQFGCRRVAPLLFAQSQNAPLPPRDSARLRAHLASCVPCQVEAKELAAVGQMLRRNVPAAPLSASDLWSRIEAEIAPTVPSSDTASDTRRPMARPAPFVPALGGMAWAGSAAIVLVWGGWMTYGSGYWGNSHHVAQMSAAGMAETNQMPPATLTILPPTPAAAPVKSESGLADAARSTVSGVSAVAANGVSAVAANSVKPKNVGRPSVARSAPRPDPFAPLASHEDSTPKRPSGLASLSAPTRHPRLSASAVTSTPATLAQSNTDSTMPVSPASDTVVDVASAGVNSSGVEAPIASSVNKPASVSSVYADSTAPSASATMYGGSSAMTTPVAEEAARTSPAPSGAGGTGAFSVADAATRAQRQHALFSYSRP